MPRNGEALKTLTTRETNQLYTADQREIKNTSHTPDSQKIRNETPTCGENTLILCTTDEQT